VYPPAATPPRDTAGSHFPFLMEAVSTTVRSDYCIRVYNSDFKPWVRTRTFGGYAKKLNKGRKRPLLGYLFKVITYKFEITAAILITNILLI
jgi:hypothetical protein